MMQLNDAMMKVELRILQCECSETKYRPSKVRMFILALSILKCWSYTNESLRVCLGSDGSLDESLQYNREVYLCSKTGYSVNTTKTGSNL